MGFPAKTRMNRYYATSNNIQIQNVNVLKEYGWWIEFNPGINMYRANTKAYLPLNLMGYERNKSILIKNILRVLKNERNRKRK